MRICVQGWEVGKEERVRGMEERVDRHRSGACQRVGT